MKVTLNILHTEEGTEQKFIKHLAQYNFNLAIRKTSGH
jgi:hypothetical protein